MRFEDGPAQCSLDPDMYGVTGGKQWALLVPTPVELGSLSSACARQSRGRGQRGSSSQIVEAEVVDI